MIWCEQWAYIQLCRLSWTSRLLHTTSEQEVDIRWMMTAISQHLKEPKLEENMCHAGRLCSPRFFQKVTICTSQFPSLSGDLKGAALMMYGPPLQCEGRDKQ